MAIVIGNDAQLGTLGDYDDVTSTDDTSRYNNAFAMFGVPQHHEIDDDSDAEAGQLGELGAFGISNTTWLVGGAVALGVGGYFLAKKYGYL